MASSTKQEPRPYKLTVTLTSASKYSQSAAFRSERGPTEAADDFEKRVWKERLHVTDNGEVYIPASALKQCLVGGAKYLNEKIKGQGQKTWAGKIEKAVRCPDDVPLGIKAGDVTGEWIYVNADGVRGSGKRVYRCFPRIDSWKAEVTLLILDPILDPDTVVRQLTAAGAFIGIGRWRPEKGGENGTFTVGRATVEDL